MINETRGEKMLKAYLIAIFVALAATFPGTAKADDLSALMTRIATASENLAKAAHKPNARLADVANKAASLSAILVSLVSAIDREPGEAAEHADTLKRIAQDQINLGLALMSSANMEDGDENATVTIEQFGALAESIRDSAQTY